MQRSAKLLWTLAALSTALTPSIAAADGRHRGGWNGVNNNNGWTAPHQERESRARDWHNNTSFNHGAFSQPRHNGWNGHGVRTPRYAKRWVQSGWNNGWNNGWNYPGTYGRYDRPYTSSWNSGWNNSGWGNTYSYSYNDYYYRNRRTKTDTVVLGVGLGVLGLAVASAASKSKKNRDWDDDRNRRDVRDWNDPDDNRSYRGVPEPDYDPALPPAINSSCLQTREYQTTITVGGTRVPAYGLACLQPDGSWRQGPPVQEPR
jgi:hypothetical protein